MKVLELTGVGIDSVRMGERAEPALPPGQVRIKVGAISLNYRDLLVAKGFLPTTYPRIPVSDCAGQVVETGSGVTRVAVGDRVFATFYPDWVSGPIAPHKFARDRGGADDGVAAEYLVLPEGELVKTPAHLSDLEAAALPCAGVTAWSAVMGNGGLKPGDSVLIQGTGGVALLALQFAVAAGAEAWIISSSDEKLEKARELGARCTLNYRNTPEWGANILERTGGRGVDRIVDVVGGASFAQSVTAIAFGGRISQVGVLGGYEASYPVPQMMVKGAHIDGIIAGSREDAEHMARAIELHAIRPPIDRTFEFQNYSEALHYIDQGNSFGKIVLMP